MADRRAAFAGALVIAGDALETRRPVEEPPGDKCICRNYCRAPSAATRRPLPGPHFRHRVAGRLLLWALPAEYPVLVYTHVHLFSKEHWQDCLTVKAAQPGWWEILDRYGVNLVVVEAELHTELVRALKEDSSWQIVLDETGLPSKRDPRTRPC